MFLHKIISRKTFFKLAFCWRLERSMTKVAGSGSESRSISQRHGSPNPDPYQNVMDPQHCLVLTDSDPGGPKTYRYGSGSGSATPGIRLNILPILFNENVLIVETLCKCLAALFRRLMNFYLAFVRNQNVRQG
jgi:hypothetical protein